MAKSVARRTVSRETPSGPFSLLVDFPKTIVFRGKRYFKFPGVLPITGRGTRALAKRIVGRGFKIRLFRPSRGIKTPLVYTRPAMTSADVRQVE